jgi:transcription initiation factor TFIID subunit 12
MSLVRKIWIEGICGWHSYHGWCIFFNLDTDADGNNGSSGTSSPLTSVPSICLHSLQAPATPGTTNATVQPSSAYKSAEAASASSGPTLMNANPGDLYPAISQTLNTTNPGAVPWPATRPTLSGGLASGRLSGKRVIFTPRIAYKPYRPGTPSQIARSSEDVTMMSLDDNRTRKRNTPGDQSMRRTIQDLVSSIDPNVKIEPEVEDVRCIATVS